MTCGFLPGLRRLTPGVAVMKANSLLVGAYFLWFRQDILLP